MVLLFGFVRLLRGGLVSPPAGLVGGLSKPLVRGLGKLFLGASVHTACGPLRGCLVFVLCLFARRVAVWRVLVCRMAV